MANILVSLKEPITAPDGEEYKAVWGEKQPAIDQFVVVGNVGLDRSNVLAVSLCPEKPTKTTQHTEYAKCGAIPVGEPTTTLIPNIYYSE